VRRTQKRRLRQVDFVFAGQSLRGLEQSPDTRSKWAAMARGGQKVNAVSSGGLYVGNVADGKLTRIENPRHETENRRVQ